MFSHSYNNCTEKGFLGVGFTQSYAKKKGKHHPNLGEFSLTGMPAGRNRKGGIPSRKRQKKCFKLASAYSIASQKPRGECIL